MRGIAGKEQPAEAHRLDHETAQGRDALFDRGPGRQALGHLRIQPQLQFRPEALIGPFFDPLGQRALQIVAAPSVRAHAAQREAAFMVGVDELILHRRGIR